MMAVSAAVAPMNPVAGGIGTVTGMGLFGLGTAIQGGAIWLGHKLLVPAPHQAAPSH